MREIVEHQRIPCQRDLPRTAENLGERVAERATQRMSNALHATSSCLLDELLQRFPREGRHGGSAFSGESLRLLAH